MADQTIVVVKEGEVSFYCPCGATLLTKDGTVTTSFSNNSLVKIFTCTRCGQIFKQKLPPEIEVVIENNEGALINVDGNTTN